MMLVLFIMDGFPPTLEFEDDFIYDISSLAYEFMIEMLQDDDENDEGDIVTI